MNNKNVGPHFLQIAEIWESDSKWHWALRFLSGWFICCWKWGIEVPYNYYIVPISLLRSLNIIFHTYLGVLPFDVLIEHFIWLRFLSFLSVSVILVLFSFFNWLPYSFQGLPWWLSDKRIHLLCRRPRFNPWVGKIPWRKKWQPTPVLWPGKSCSPWGVAKSQSWLVTEHNSSQYSYSWFKSVFTQHCDDSWVAEFFMKTK